MSIKAIIERLRLYALTSYHLKPVQILYRIKSVFQTKCLHRFSWYRRSFAKKATGNESFSIVKFPYIRQANFQVSDISVGKFRFLNRTVDLGIPTNWHPASETKLWTYNLHYFDFLRSVIRLHQDQNNHEQNNHEQNKHSQHNNEPYVLFRRLVNEWISSCPVAMPLAWDAYPISLRLNNWLRAYMVFEYELSQDTEFARKLRHSMYTQSAYLEKHLEYQLLNNHLLENGRALWLMGRFFNSPDADRWREKGFSILTDGLRTDFYADGGHDERSPMYHQIMLDVYQEVFDVLKTADEPVTDLLKSRLKEIKNWLANVLHPDGNLSLFQDCAFDIAGDPAEFIGHGTLPANGLTALKDSGYYVLRDHDKNSFVIFDCGSMGPNHRNGHGHCGALNFEASIDGVRFIVDSGVSDYSGDIKWRDYFRSTRAHNTVVVDGCEQSEIWERYRVARPYQIEDVVSSESDNLTFVAASHTGYRRLPGKVTHRRWMCYVDNTFWVVCDYIEGDGTHNIESLLHFHPDAQVVENVSATEFGHSGKLVREQASLQVLCWGASSVHQYHGQQTPLQGFYAPRFGECFENTAWGLKQNKELPAWLGYVLVPSESKTRLEFTSADKSAELRIKTIDSTYRLSFNHSEVVLDIA